MAADGSKGKCVTDQSPVEDQPTAGPGVQVIARAARVLRALEGKSDGLSLGQIARQVGLARSTVQRIVAALATEDFVTEAHPGHGVRIGPGLARISASLSSNYGEILHPHLVALRDAVGETVDLSILSGGSAVFIDQIPGQQRLVAFSAIGERFPLHCTANGKAILAGFGKDDSATLIAKSLAEHPRHRLVDRATQAPGFRSRRARRRHQRSGRRRARRFWPVHRRFGSRPDAAIQRSTGLARAGAARISRQASSRCGRRLTT
jgi:DNA-binding IclR family transcriptional regulator